jgi:hypothetical protein
MVRSGSEAAGQRGSRSHSIPATLPPCRAAALPRCFCRFAASLLIAACELTETTVPLGEPRVIVQAVYSRGANRQFVVVEESRTGERPGPPGEPDSIPPQSPSLPSVGALVTLAYSAGSPCGGAVDTLPPLDDSPGVYQAEGLCITDPGDTVLLRVITADGRVVNGSTVVPGASRVAVSTGSDTAAFPGDLLVLNRDRDTLRIELEAVAGRAMQVEVRRYKFEGTDPGKLVFYLVTDSLGLAVPGDLVNPFEGDDGEPIFLPGDAYDVAVAVTDSNYYDFVRSRSDPFTGRGFINRLEGGIGVFGSVEVYYYDLMVSEGPLSVRRSALLR